MSKEVLRAREMYQIQPRITFDSKEDMRFFQEMSRQGGLRPLLSKFLKLYRKEPTLVDDLLERGTLADNPSADHEYYTAFMEFQSNQQALIAYQELLMQQHDNDVNKVLDSFSVEGFQKYNETAREITTVKSSVTDEVILSLQSTIKQLQTELQVMNQSRVIPTSTSVGLSVQDIESIKQAIRDDIVKELSKADLVGSTHEVKLVESVEQEVNTMQIVEDVVEAEVEIVDVNGSTSEEVVEEHSESETKSRPADFKQSAAFANELLSSMRI